MWNATDIYGDTKDDVESVVKRITEMRHRDIIQERWVGGRTVAVEVTVTYALPEPQSVGFSDAGGKDSQQ